MTLKELSEIKTSNPQRHWSQHVLQSCQVIACAYLTDGTTTTAIYDADSGHWLSIPDFREIGYAGIITIHGTEKRIAHFKEFI